MLNPNHNSIQKLCEFRVVPDRIYFIQISQSNQYYCVINTPILITENCPNESISTTSISTNGVIKLKPGCSIMTNEIKLTGFHTISSKPEILTPLFHLTKINSKILAIMGNITHLSNQNYSIITFSNYNNEILDISKKLKENLAKTQEKFELEQMVGENSNKTWWTLISIIAISILIYIIYKKCLS